MSIDHGTAVALTATVHGAAHRPTGLVTFLAVGRTLQTVPISPVTGRASWVVTTSKSTRFSVRYQGDGYNMPSGASAVGSR
jgi:hypothetical protein